MRPKSLILLMLALGCGLVASIGISQVMDRRNQQPAAVGETEAIFVAMQNIEFGDQLSTQVLKIEQWPKDKVPEGALSKLEDVDGRRARTKLYAGEPILEAKLIGGSETSGPSEVIPKGFRVVSVQVDAVSSIGSLLKPGDRVDVLVYVNRNPAAGINESGAKTILQDIKVFAVNEQWRRPEEAGEEAIAAKTVSMLVTPNQAEKVTLATEMGTIRLIMRSPDDDTASEIAEGTNASDIFASASDKSDRTREQNTPEKAPDDSMLAWLNQQQAQQTEQQPAAPVVEAVPVEQFMMEILEGGEMRTIEFRKEGAENAKWQNAANAGYQPGDAAASPSAAPAPVVDAQPLAGPQESDS